MNLKCNHCDKVCGNKGSLSIHEQHCQLNPTRVQRKRSPRAGAQKGHPNWAKGLILGRPAHWDEKYSFDQVLIENSTYGRTHLRKRLIETGLIPYCCSICDSPPEWRGAPMPLILDHINGVNNDNRIENLRFVCSNCDTQLPTYKSKNRKK